MRYLSQFGSVTANEAEGVVVDDGDSIARVMLSADEVYDFALGSRILDEETGLPLQLTDGFLEEFGVQEAGSEVSYVRDGWSLRILT